MEALLGILGVVAVRLLQLRGLARSEPELLVLEVVDLAQVACEVFEDAGARMADCRLRIDHQLAPAIVHSDRRLLTLLVSNLLEPLLAALKTEGRFLERLGGRNRFGVWGI